MDINQKDMFREFIVLEEETDTMFLTLYRGHEKVADVRYCGGKPIYRYIKEESLVDIVLDYEIDAYVESSDYFNWEIDESTFLTEGYDYLEYEDKAVSESPADSAWDSPYITPSRANNFRSIEEIVYLSGALSVQLTPELN